ncbi:MAG: hypothetical protein AAF710_11545, partial [Planctomycetota bacterium]
FALSAPPTEYLPHEAAVRVRSAGSWWVPMPGPTASADQPTVVLAAPSREAFERFAQRLGGADTGAAAAA